MKQISSKLSMILLLMVCTVYESLAQTTIDAEFRPRTELRQGFRKPLADTLVPALVTLQHTRLNADYKSKILNARISLQDARIWGKHDTKVNDSKVEVYEVALEA